VLTNVVNKLQRIAVLILTSLWSPCQFAKLLGVNGTNGNFLLLSNSHIVASRPSVLTDCLSNGTDMLEMAVRISSGVPSMLTAIEK
jgi:hypothetical protein